LLTSRCIVDTESKTKALQGGATGPGGPQHYGLAPVPGGVVSGQPQQPGAPVGGPVGVQNVGGADPINALQTLSKQPLPAGMTQQGDSFITPISALSSGVVGVLRK